MPSGHLLALWDALCIAALLRSRAGGHEGDSGPGCQSALAKRLPVPQLVLLLHRPVAEGAGACQGQKGIRF